MVDIPSLTLSTEQIHSHQQTMRKGAASLKRLAEVTGTDHKTIRTRLFKPSCRVVFTPGEWPELTPEQASVFVQAIPDIQAVRSIEWQMLCGFSRLARKHALAWAKKVHGSISDFRDFEQEALLAVLDAIYTYNQEDTSFLTYAWYVIRNRLANTANKAHPFGPLSNEAVKLLYQFEKVKMGMNRAVTNQEVYEAMALSDDQINVIENASIKCVQGDRCGSAQYLTHHGDDYPNDYTAARRGIDSETDTVPCNYEIRDAVEKANLTPLERKIVNTSLYPHYGWQQEIANETINPQTGKPYTRARISQILQIALRKIKSAYLHVDGKDDSFPLPQKIREGDYRKLA